MQLLLPLPLTFTLTLVLPFLFSFFFSLSLSLSIERWTRCTSLFLLFLYSEPFLSLDRLLLTHSALDSLLILSHSLLHSFTDSVIRCWRCKWRVVKSERWAVSLDKLCISSEGRSALTDARCRAATDWRKLFLGSEEEREMKRGEKASDKWTHLSKPPVSPSKRLHKPGYGSHLVGSLAWACRLRPGL